MNIYAWVGEICGGALLVYLLSRLIEWVIVQRIMDDETTGRIVSVVSAMVIAFVISGFGNANGGPWNPFPGGVAYSVGGAFVLFARLAALGRAQRAEDDRF